MEPYPTSLQLNGEQRELVIQWSDQTQRRYGFKELRNACPCATCREKRRDTTPPSPLTVLTPEQLQPIDIVSMKPVGNYAYTVEFSDGHNTGIYTFENLYSLGREIAS